MIRLHKIGMSLGSEIVNNFEIGANVGKSTNFISSKVGFKQIRKSKSSETVTSLCIAALDNLKEQTEIFLEEVDCLVLCTQTPEHHGIPHGSSLIHKALELGSQVACFDISLGCSGYTYGLSAVKSFMQTNGLKRGLFFTCDPYTKIIDDTDWDTRLLFGDGATVSLLQTEGRFDITPGLFSTNGSLGHSISRTDTDKAALAMHGSNVFKFSINEVPNQINNFIEKKGWSIEDVDLFALHQGSRFIVENIRKKMEIPEEKMPFCAAETGNLVSSSIPAMLWQLDAEEKLSTVNRIILSGFGVGLSWATLALIKHNN